MNVAGGTGGTATSLADHSASRYRTSLGYGWVRRPQRLARPAEPRCMTPLTARDIARLITDSVQASLAQAIAHGCSAADVPAIARAIGGNAGMAIYLEILERGIERDDG